MTDKQDKIHIIATGGTIDKHYNCATQSNEILAKSSIPDYLEKIIKPTFSYSFEEIIKMDSRDMDKTHHVLLLNSIEKTTSNKIFILYGTDEMVNMAQRVADTALTNNKTIIFAGSMIPLTGFYQSDAPFNLGYAIAKTEELPHGVYICMNGGTFKPDQVVKNVDKSRFEHKDDS